MSMDAFGKSRAQQPGNFPSPSEIVAKHQAARNQGAVHGRDQAEQVLPSPSQIVAAHRDAAGKERSIGEQEMAQNGPRPGQLWEDWLNDREKPDGNSGGGYQRDRNRNLPEEERVKSHDLGR